MSNLINPILIDGYDVFENEGSVQGACQGSFEFQPEIDCDRALKEERRRIRYIIQRKKYLQEELDRIITNIAVGTRRGVKQETLAKHREEAFEIRIELEQLNNVI